MPDFHLHFYGKDEPIRARTMSRSVRRSSRRRRRRTPTRSPRRRERSKSAKPRRTPRMVSSTPPKGWIGKPPGSFEEPQRGRQSSLTMGNPPGAVEEPQRRRQSSLTMGNTQPPTTWQGPSLDYEGPPQDPGQFNASRPLLVQQAAATSSSSQRPVGDPPQQVASRSPPNYFQQRPQDAQGYSSNMQEINQEIEAALAIPVEYSCYPPLGKVPASVINYLWPSTDYNKVASYKNRSEWMQDVVARIPSVTYEIFSQSL